MDRELTYNELEKQLQKAHREINFRKRAEKAMQKNDSRYQAFFHKSVEGIYRLKFNPPIPLDSPEEQQVKKIFQGTIEDCNDSLAEMYNFNTPKEIIGLLVSKFMSPLNAQAAKTVKAIIQSEYRLTNYETKEKDRNGNTQYFINSCVGIIKERQVLGIWGTQRSITKRKKAELKLEKALRQLKKLKKQLEAESFYLQEEIKLQHNHLQIVGESDAIKYVLFKAEKIAISEKTVLVTGETGTGKELVARAIHQMSKRKDRPLIKVNCGALPTSLVESELFGHEKGAFTGAHDRKIGRFEAADGATLFLDEIGELPLVVQAKLLQVLQDGEFERVGSYKTMRVDVRVICATNKNLEKEVDEGRFRQDLLYRLNVLPITIPPLRNRREDIPLLASSILSKACKRLGIPAVKQIPSSAMNLLKSYSWPGNVREMESVIERAIMVSNGDKLQLQDSLRDKISVGEELGRPKTLPEVERNHILMVLDRTNWKIAGENGAARILGLNRSTLYGKMRKHGIKYKKIPL